MSKPYHKLEEAACLAYATLKKISNGDHEALEAADAVARNLLYVLMQCEVEDVRLDENG